MKHLKECSFCHRKVYKLAARGLCANCYYREQRNGTPAYQTRTAKSCEVADCGTIALARGYCIKHYHRWKREGDPLSERSERWGHRSSHPLIHAYGWAKKRGISPEWNEFWDFVRDVGGRPSDGHRLERKDFSKPLGPSNFQWNNRKIPLPVTNLQERAAYARAYRVLNPRNAKTAQLKKMFGITLEDYERMLAEQGGGCAICGGQETRERYKYFSVDHCHKNQKIRGLLCSDCNRGLGFFQDSAERLTSASGYLRQHE